MVSRRKAEERTQYRRKKIIKNKNKNKNRRCQVV